MFREGDAKLEQLSLLFPLHAPVQRSALATFSSLLCGIVTKTLTKVF